MRGLTQQEFAERAGTSQQSVSKALRRGYLVRAADGRLDPRLAGNARWIELHRQGSDDRGRWLGSHLGPGGTNFRASRANGQTDDTELAGSPISDAELAAMMRDNLEPQPGFSDAEIKAFLAEQRIFGEPDDRVIDLLTEIKAGMAALRCDLLIDRPRDHTAELRQAIAALNIKVNVCFHQLTLAIKGEPMTVKDVVFGPGATDKGSSDPPAQKVEAVSGPRKNS
jgi:hypothetical protein